jgi:hypothetical protein
MECIHLFLGFCSDFSSVNYLNKASKIGSFPEVDVAVLVVVVLGFLTVVVVFVVVGLFTTVGVVGDLVVMTQVSIMTFTTSSTSVPVDVISSKLSHVNISQVNASPVVMSPERLGSRIISPVVAISSFLLFSRFEENHVLILVQVRENHPGA